jgi:uncharacterized phage protein gp47/JayE
MPTFTRPTLTELLSRVAGDIAARTEGRAFIRRSVERALGFAMSGIAHGLHGHLAYLQAQLYPQTADAEGLAEWGDLRDVPRKPGAYAAGQVTFEGASANQVPLGTLVAAGGGALYRVGAGLGSGSYDVQSVETGTAKNLAVGERLLLVSPIAGVSPAATVSAPLSGGADVEELEAYRERVLTALRAAPAYGAPGDYERWAREREGVTAAWEFDRRMGPGTVSLGFAFGDRDDVIPTASDVAAMQAYIDALRPADMVAVYVRAPVRNELHLRVTARGSMTEAAMRDALVAFFRTDVDLEQPLSLSQVDEALSGVAGEISHAIDGVDVVVQGGAPTPLSLAGGVLVPTSWGLFTFGSLTLTVVS